MTAPQRCWNCGYAQPPVVPFPQQRCVSCGAQLYRAASTGRVRWVAHRPPGAPPARGRSTTMPYAGPPRYRFVPRWGFPPSIWTTPTPPDQPAAPVPTRDLRSVIVLAAAAGVMCVLAAGSEAWRYSLLARGRTEVLRAGEIQWNDALVVSTGWAAALLGLAVVVALLPALARTEAFATRRAVIRPTRGTGRRLCFLLIPGFNLYGAGAVLAELDAVLRMPAAGLGVDAGVASSGPASGTAMRWRERDLPVVGVPETLAVAAEPGPTGPTFRSPRRLLSAWWAAWVVNGVLVGGVVVRSLIPGSLQVRADLVWWHVIVQAVGALVAFLTVAVLRGWVRILQPVVDAWPVGWILQPAPAPGVPAASANPPAPAAEPRLVPSD